MVNADKHQSEDKKTMLDRFRREMKYLRVSITDRCNLNCMYCRPYGFLNSISDRETLSYEELYRIIEIGAGLGIEKVRITGGEPLVRRGIAEFMAEVNRIKGVKDLSLTTNGVLLKHHLESLTRSGLRRINISMDTLRRDHYKTITGFDGFQQVWDGIRLAEKMRIYPIKINMVVMRGVNDLDVLDMARLSLFHKYHIRFIEYMPVGVGRNHKKNISVTVHEIKKRVETIGKLVPVSGSYLDGPARRYRFEDAPGELGFISAMSDHFCQSCNRIRLTSNGFLKPCLLSDIKKDIINPLRKGSLDSDLEGIFMDSVKSKPQEHPKVTTQHEWVTDFMSAIGG